MTTFALILSLYSAGFDDRQTLGRKFTLQQCVTAIDIAQIVIAKKAMELPDTATLECIEEREA